MGFFKKPSWAATSSKPTRKDFYRRADLLYEDIIAQEKELEQREQEKETPYNAKENIKQAEGGRKHAIDPNENQHDSSSSPGSDKSKRRRRQSSRSRSRSRTQSPKRSASPAFQFDPSRDDVLDLESLKKQTKVENPPLPAATPHTVEAQHTEQTSDNESDIVVLGSSPEPEPTIARIQTHTTSPKALGTSVHPADEDEESEDFDSESDEEVKELMRAARRRTRLARETKDPHISEDYSRENSHLQAVPGEDDIVIRIYITSPIEDTAPIMVARKINQNLGDVRKVWCSKQDLQGDLPAKIFLTWKDIRVFDATTCQSLGIQADEEIPEALLQEEDFVPDENVTYVHMIAYTRELWDAHKARKRRILFGEVDDESEEEEEQPATTTQITIRAAGLEALALKIVPQTTVGDAIVAFRGARDLAATKEVILSFDGDNLDPLEAFSTYEVEDEDVIDAHVQ